MGAGYSNLNTFAEIEPEVVKLDLSLVRSVDSRLVKQKVVRSMVTLCADMGKLVIAEGVETEGEREALRELGCDLLQGYLFARPSHGFAAVQL